MSTFMIISLGENLAETLDIGNYTTDGQKIKAQNGGGVLNLRLNNDSEILLTNDDVNFLLSYLALFPSGASLGFNSTSGLYLEVTADHVIFTPVAFAAYFGMSASGGGLWATSLQTAFASFTITALTDAGIDVTQNSGTDFLFLNTGLQGVFDSTMKTGIQRSVIISGKGLTAKTNDTTYLNQISFQEPGILFDCILKSGAITADRLLTLPDKDGELAVNTYAEKWTTYNATLNATWETIIITDALETSLIEIVCYNTDVISQDVGVRESGSSLVRRLSIAASSSLTMTVKTDASKQIEVFANASNKIDFHFSAQL